MGESGCVRRCCFVAESSMKPCFLNFSSVFTLLFAHSCKSMRRPLLVKRRVLKDQPYGVVIEPLIRGSVDALRQHCPAKRLTPMGLSADESAKCFANFIDEIGYYGMYLGGRCGCFWVKLRRNDAILDGQSAVLRNEFTRSDVRAKHTKTSP